MRRVRVGLLLLAGVFAVLAAAGMASRWLRTSVAPPAWADDYDLTAVPPEAVAPGTVVERGPPIGWSHLIIKSLPRVKQSEKARVPTKLGREFVIQKASWMFTVFTADVVPEKQGSHTRYRLRAIGLGLGVNVKGRDIVLTADTAEQFGEPMDRIKKDVLNTGYSIQQQSRVAVHGPSFALVDTPVTFRCGERNRMVRFRYAMLVDPPSGRLDVFCWQIGAENGECADLKRAVLLNPNDIDEAELLVDPAGFSDLGIPNELAFGVDDLPPHRLEVTLPPELTPLAGKTRFTPEEAHTLEVGIRKLLPK
jgi:hypothetical protein